MTSAQAAGTQAQSHSSSSQIGSLPGGQLGQADGSQPLADETVVGAEEEVTDAVPVVVFPPVLARTPNPESDPTSPS